MLQTELGIYPDKLGGKPNYILQSKSRQNGRKGILHSIFADRIGHISRQIERKAISLANILQSEDYN